jgi:Tol biopolymer transport system component
VAIAVGSRIGPYEVTAAIGAGGMGEVWRATDTTLGREVAIKVLPDTFTSDPERLARLEREARTLASLNHPNVAAIYGIERTNGTPALIMELVEGATLAERIARGPLPLEDAVSIARHVVQALEAAHGQGIVHRDLKPANVMVRPDGIVKVLDFGLARGFESAHASSPGWVERPTLTSVGTGRGVVLGTVAYMSPEQASGRPVDGRADIWAFGVLLFEMVSGRRPFEGDGITEVLSAVLRSEPNWEALPDVPARIRLLIRACLQKDLRQRLAHAQDVRLALEGAFETTPAVPGPRPKSRILLPMAVVAVVAAMAAGLLTAALRRPAPERGRIVRFSHVLPTGLGFRYSDRNVLAVSPDGQRYVFHTPRGLYLRSMDEGEARLLPGTDEPLESPFFSPDGQSVGYFQAGRLKRLAMAGGSPVVIAPAGRLWGATWAADGSIFFAQREGILRVPASGGTPVLVVPASEGEQLDGPQLLPDGDSLLFSVARHAVFTQANPWDAAEVVVQSLSSGARRVLLSNGSDARYVRSGHLVYAVEDALHGVRFDANALEVRGGPVSLVVGVGRALSTASANYEVSDEGTLFHVLGTGAATRSPLVWVDREGRTDAVPVIRPQLFRTPRLSHDDQRVLLSADGDVRVYDLATGRETRLTSGRQSGFPAWHANGSVAYTSSGSQREGHTDAWLLPPNSDGGAARLTLLDGQVDVDSWSPDGRTLAVHHHKPDGDTDVIMIAFEDGKSSEPQPFAVGPSDEMAAVFSPDGRYVAHLSNETGRTEVVIRPFRGSGPKITVSSGGAGDLAWARNGELFYRRPSDSTMVAVRVSTTPALMVGRSQELFRTAGLLYGVSAARYAVSSDGKRFLMSASELRVDQGGSAPRPAVQVVLNWRQELQRLVP